MTRVSRSALVPYRAGQMYALVADVERYPDFLPWCSSAAILERAGDELEARLEISKGPVRKRFTTRNRMLEGSAIEMRLVSGPFRHLHGQWRFHGLGDAGCKVALDLEFELSSAVVRRLLGPIFEEIANTMVDAFCRRAAQLYGPRQAGG